MKYSVYTHINKINGKMYFGITSREPEIRWGKGGNHYTLTNQPKFYRAIKKYGWNNFEHRVLGSNFTEEQAKKLEMVYIKLFNTVEQGYNISLGGEGNTKYTDEQLLELTKQYKTKKEFRIQNDSLYQLCRNRGILKKATWLERCHKWTYESCYSEAQKYTTLREFSKCSASAYTSARINGWLSDYTWLKRNKPKGYWTYDTCYQEAQKYHSKWEFAQNSNTAYKTALKNNWLSDFFPL